MDGYPMGNNGVDSYESSIIPNITLTLNVDYGITLVVVINGVFSGNKNCRQNNGEKGR